MSILSGTKAAAASPITDEGPGRHPALAALIAAVQVAATGLLAAAAVAVLIWVATPRITASWVEALRVGVDGWAVAHGATVVLTHGTFDVAPIALLAIVIRLAWNGAGRIRDALSTGERQAAGHGGRRLRTQVLTSGLVFCACYAGLGVAAVALAGSTQARVPLGSAALACLGVAATGYAAATYPLWWRETAVTVQIEHIVRGAGVALLGWLGLSAIVLVGAIGFGWSRIFAVHDALQPGVLGSVVLVVLQLLLLPTALTWASAYVAGPGFSVGAGTHLALSGTELGPLPALPLLGALPHPGEHPVLAWLVPGLVVLSAAAAGHWLRTRRPAQARPGSSLVDVIWMAALVAATAAILAALAGGSVGGGRMSHVGPNPLVVGFVIAVQMLAGGAIGVLAGPRLAEGRAGRRLLQAADHVGRLGRRAGTHAGRATASAWGRLRRRS